MTPCIAQVELEEAEASGGGVHRVPLTVQGLTPGGYLLATDAAGAGFELHPDGNRRAPMAAHNVHGNLGRLLAHSGGTALPCTAGLIAM